MIDSPLNRFRQNTIIKIEMNRDKDKEKTQSFKSVFVLIVIKMLLFK